MKRPVTTKTALSNSWKPILALILTISNFFLVCSCSNKTLTKSNLYFDTVCTITIYAGGSREVLDEAFNKLSEYDRLFDRYEDGELAGLSTQPKKVNGEVIELVDENLDYSRLTDNVFSPALGRLIDLWHINSPETREPPAFDQIAAALEHIDPTGIVVNNEEQTISLKDPEETVDLGATVKGYVANKTAQFLKDNGVTSAVIDLGGNITLIGKKENRPFNIGIDDPKDPSKILATLELEDTSIVTSGTYQRYFTDSQGRRYHHILDPRTGYPADSGLSEVVVIGEDALEDDFLSTALLIMGLDQARNFIQQNKEFQDNFYILVSDQTIYKSQDLKSFNLEPDQSQYQIEVF